MAYVDRNLFDVARTFRSWLGGMTRSADSGDTTTTDTGITPPSRSASSASVSVGQALGIPMVYRAIQIHAVSAKQLSIQTTRYGLAVNDHPLVRRPDPDTTRSAWIEQSVVSLACTGNCYYEIIRDTFGQVVALPVLNPIDVRIDTDEQGRVTGYQYRGRTLTPNKVSHITLLRIPGTAYGLGPIQAAQPDLRGAISTRDYAANWLDDSGVPTGVLKSDQSLTREKAQEAKQFWADNAGHKNGVVVLGNGLSYQPIFLTPKDVQFLEAQQFNVTQIARMMGTPASLMLAAVEGNSQTYANVEQDWLAYVRFTLMGYLVEIEDALSDMLPGAQRAKFNIEALLRADTTSRYNSYAVAIDKGFLTADEVRLLEGWAPLSDEQRREIELRWRASAETNEIKEITA
jgi:HK97 family phage portal protein